MRVKPVIAENAREKKVKIKMGGGREGKGSSKRDRVEREREG
jgi:hypothetical protein